MSTIDELIEQDIAEYKRSNHFERDVKYAMTALELYRWGQIEEGIKKIDAENIEFAKEIRRKRKEEESKK